MWEGGLEVAPRDALPARHPRIGGRRARLTAAAAISAELRDEIVALRLAPGSPLVEKDLTSRFRVSRTPLREALIRLAEEGLVDVRPQAGTSVSRIPLAAIPEAVVVRQALEGALVELAAARSAAEDVAGLDRIVDRQAAFAAMDDREAFHESDEAFHEAIATASGHPGIWRIVRQSKVQIDRCRRLTLPTPGRMDQVIAEHRVILAAIGAGDVPGARAAMRVHLDAVLPDARLLARRHPDYFD